MLLHLALLMRCSDYFFILPKNRVGVYLFHLKGFHLCHWYSKIPTYTVLLLLQLFVISTLIFIIEAPHGEQSMNVYPRLNCHMIYELRQGTSLQKLTLYKHLGFCPYVILTIFSTFVTITLIISNYVVVYKALVIYLQLNIFPLHISIKLGQ